MALATVHSGLEFLEHHKIRLEDWCCYGCRVSTVGRFWSFLKKKLWSQFQFRFINEWVGLLLREVPGMGDCCSDKGGLLTGAQSQQSNWKWYWQDQGSVGVCLRKYNITMLTYSSNQVLAEMMKSHSTSLTAPSSLTFLCYFPPVDSLKVIASMCSANAVHKQAIIDLSKVACQPAGTQCTMSCGRNQRTCAGVRWATQVSTWTDRT